MKRPHEVHLSREDGEALRKRLAGDTLTAHDRQVRGHILEWYCWLRFAWQAARYSLKRLRALVCGEPPQKRQPKPPDQSSGSRDRAGGAGSAMGQRRPGHGRHGAQAYVGAPQVACRPAHVAMGQRCLACGCGRLSALPPGGEVQLDGNALLSALCYALEKLRWSAGGQVCTAAALRAAGAEQYTARARATLVVSRYSLGVPMSRLAAYQALVGVPVAAATQWEHSERVADCASPVFEALQRLAAPGAVL